MELLERSAICHELIKVVTEDFPTKRVDANGVMRGHIVENVTALIISKALKRVLEMPANKSVESLLAAAREQRDRLKEDWGIEWRRKLSSEQEALILVLEEIEEGV